MYLWCLAEGLKLSKLGKVLAVEFSHKNWSHLNRFSVSVWGSHLEWLWAFKLMSYCRDPCMWELHGALCPGYQGGGCDQGLVWGQCIEHLFLQSTLLAIFTDPGPHHCTERFPSSASQGSLWNQTSAKWEMSSKGTEWDRYTDERASCTACL